MKGKNHFKVDGEKLVRIYEADGRFFKVFASGYSGVKKAGVMRYGFMNGEVVEISSDEYEHIGQEFATFLMGEY